MHREVVLCKKTGYIQVSESNTCPPSWLEGNESGGGPHFSFSEGFSLFVDCEDQAEVDEYWNKLIDAGAIPSQCGWITDPFGVTWQLVPRRFMELIRDRNPKKEKAAMEAMMTMVKLDVAALERAYDQA